MPRVDRTASSQAKVISARFAAKYEIARDVDHRQVPRGRSPRLCDNSSVTPVNAVHMRSSVFHRSFRRKLPSAVRGEGVYVWDSTGNKYLDLAGSAAVNLIGHGVPEIASAMAEQASELEFVHTSQFTTPIAEQYAEELLLSLRIRLHRWVPQLRPR